MGTWSTAVRGGRGARNPTHTGSDPKVTLSGYLQTALTWFQAKKLKEGNRRQDPKRRVQGRQNISVAKVLKKISSLINKKKKGRHARRKARRVKERQLESLDEIVVKSLPTLLL